MIRGALKAQEAVHKQALKKGRDGLLPAVTASASKLAVVPGEPFDDQAHCTISQHCTASTNMFHNEHAVADKNLKSDGLDIFHIERHFLTFNWYIIE